jgi:hypothetical protein
MKNEDKIDVGMGDQAIWTTNAPSARSSAWLTAAGINPSHEAQCIVTAAARAVRDASRIRTTYGADITVWTAVRLSDAAHGSSAIARSYSRALTTLTLQGLVHTRAGSEASARCTRYAPTTEFEILMDGVDFDLMLGGAQTRPPSPSSAFLLASKDPEGNVTNIATKKSKEINDMRSAVNKINKAIAATVYALAIPPDWRHTGLTPTPGSMADEINVLRYVDEDGTIDHEAVRTHRQFVSDGTKKTAWGGRFVAQIHSLPSRLRQFLKINNQNTVELDVVSAQPRILFAMAGVDLDSHLEQSHPGAQDVYEAICPGVRHKAKSLMMYLVGCATSPTRTKYHLCSAVKEDPTLTLTVEEWERAKEVLQPVWHLVGTSAWARTQRKESDWMFACLLACIDELGYAPLHVHDCIIVQAADEERASEIMKRTWSEIIGGACAIKVN